MHRDAAGRAWNAFLEEEPFSTRVEIAGEGTGTIWVEQVKPIPAAIAFEIGEFLYHLRAVLDGCVYEAACLQSGQNPPPDEDKLEFVFRSTAVRFKEAGWKLGPLTDKQRNVIELMQPYNAPPDLEPRWIPFNYNRGLAMLNDWARKDRHRQLHVVATWASNIRPILEVPKAVELVEFIVPVQRFTLKGERAIASFRLSGWRHGMEIRANPNLTLDMVIDESPVPCHTNDHMNSRFQCMVQGVVQVVAAMASTFGPELFD